VAQCIPVRREAWTASLGAASDDAAQRTQALLEEIRRDKGVYRRRFRA
jgi:hypothetical protein